MKYYTNKARIWKKNNMDKVKKSWQKYNHEPENIERRKSYYQQNKERINAVKRKYYNKNFEKNRAKKHEYYLKNRDIIRARSKKYYNDWKYYNKFQTIFHYTNGKMCCNTCGIKIFELLTIDHVNGGGVKHYKQIGYANIYVWLRKNNYPQGFQILCYNCNMVKPRVTKQRYNEIIDELRQRQLLRADK